MTLKCEMCHSVTFTAYLTDYCFQVVISMKLFMHCFTIWNDGLHCDNEAIVPRMGRLVFTVCFML